MTEPTHFALPFTFANGRANVVDQDSTDDVTACVEAVLRCPLGWRDELPEFGIADQALREGGADLDELRVAVERWEPRAAVALTAGDIVALAQTVRVGVATEST
jgi:phage baseplate assembly protein W